MTIYVGGKPVHYCTRKDCKRRTEKPRQLCSTHQQCKQNAKEFAAIMGI